MIDKHRPSRIAIQSLLRGSILCWFHIMKTIGENFSQWNIPCQFGNFNFVVNFFFLIIKLYNFYLK